MNTRRTRQAVRIAAGVASGVALLAVGLTARASAPAEAYPWHTDIVATTFWVGEVFDPDAEDGSQVYSTYDSEWLESYGGCDGVVSHGVCTTEARSARNDFFPTAFTPRENPFYLDLPFDDVNDPAAFIRRAEVVPWSDDPEFRDILNDAGTSLMKNRWVEIRTDGHRCFGQIEDAGPGTYNNARYVFGTDDEQPANTRYNGAGMDVSPALNGCLHFDDLNGDSDLVDWRFVEESAVPAGPWKRVVTTSGVQ